ncbi:SusC/RagA family TonB-linked outer membrane protein [Algoriphagus chordae]|uniref:TonB-linked SusC/RagA family outer membrane protein n=1 Tax=Algoriphagus chordae TaxID=237019 RepID=A0A2W7R9N6_9BACT|nr:TonB-dependent receptor [Algoriphagus chordae]PZX56771.1 TonB-linked SusC/RagA family outer membrane protein [Algoriphagus chordae]
MKNMITQSKPIRSLVMAIPILVFSLHNGQDVYAISRVSIGADKESSSQQMENKTVIGKVIDSETGEGMPGVTVVVKGTTTGTVTDIDGAYTLTVADDASVLVFSFVGYEVQDVLIGNQSRVDVTIVPTSITMDDFVVVGYGTMKKVNLSGAVDMVEGETFENRQVGSVGEGLQGLIPNLNITRSSGKAGNSPEFNIRGFTSLNGGAPLILVDNIPVTSAELNALSPNDISSVSVLKDASASAIYGARAAFGVVLITTKVAQSEKLTVSANVIYGIKTLGQTPEIVTDPYSVMKYKHEAAAPLYNLYPEEARAYAQERSNDPSLPSVIVDPNNPEKYLYVGQTDWLNEVYNKSSPSYSANFNISKKDENINYLFSAGYYRQDGMLKYGNDIYERINLRSKVDFTITDWLKFGNNTAYSRVDYDQPYYSSWLFFHNANRTNSLDVPRNPDGSWTSAGAGLLGRLQEGGRSVSQGNDMLSKFDVDLSIVKNIFSIKADVTFRRVGNDTHSFDVPIPYKTGPDQPELYTGTNPAFSQNSSESVNHTILNAYADFKKEFGGKHFVQALVGYNQESRVLNSFNVSRSDLITTNLPSVALATGTWNGGEGYSDWAVRGAFYRVNYTFSNKYIIELNGRYDGTSRFPKDDRFGFFPSASVAWVVSDEGFMESVSRGLRLDFFKLRASYGSLGNQAVSDYGYIPSLSAGQIGQVLGGERPLTVSPPGLVAGSLTWETVESLNFGTDLTFFEGKLGVNFDAYSRKTKDMLVKGKTLPAVLGASEPKINAGDLVTKGWEGRISWNHHGSMGGSPIMIGVGFNLSDYQTEITAYDNPTGNLNDYYDGMKLGQIWGLTTDGFFQSEAELETLDQRPVGSDDQGYVFNVGDLKFQDINGDGKIDKGDWTLENHGDFKVIGNTTPRYQFGLDLNSAWKGFDVRVFFQGVGKKDWYPENGNHYFWGVYAQPWTNVQVHNLDSWSPENPDAYFPRVKAYIAEDKSELGLPQTRYLQNAAYVRLKNLTVGYSLSPKMLENSRIQKVRFYFTGENLWEVSKLKAKLDPEVIGSGGSSNTTAYPFQRTMSIGMNFTF